MSVLCSKGTLIVSQLLFSTLAYGLFIVGRRDLRKLLSSMALPSLLLNWSIPITSMTDSIVSSFALSCIVQLLRLVIILSYLGMPVNLVQCRGAAGVFDNRKFDNKVDTNKLYL